MEELKMKEDDWKNVNKEDSVYAKDVWNEAIEAAAELIFKDCGIEIENAYRLRDQIRKLKKV
jgi:3'-phosphoadenosine 5'-phosphosulfate sulfotransferase (PAPS reductase)/FAD synthetase